VPPEGRMSGTSSRSDAVAHRAHSDDVADEGDRRGGQRLEPWRLGHRVGRPGGGVDLHDLGDAEAGLRRPAPSHGGQGVGGQPGCPGQSWPCPCAAGCRRSPGPSAGQVHVIDAVRAGGDPRHQRRDLQMRRVSGAGASGSMGVSVQLFQQAWDRSSSRRARTWGAHRLPTV